MTNVYVPPGNLVVTQAVVSVPVGGDGITPVGPANPPTATAGADANARIQMETLKSIDGRLAALIILLTNAYGLPDSPDALIAAAQQDLRSLS